MPSEKQPGSEPPSPPDFNRRLELYSYQYIAIPLLLLIPILAMLGVFGETFAAKETNAAGLSMAVTFPDRMHSGMGNEMNIEITNTSHEDAPVLNVTIDHAYLEKFVNVHFTPDVTRLTDDYAIVELRDVRAGETRVINVELKGLWVGNHEATITASRDADTSVSTTISTFVFP